MPLASLHPPYGLNDVIPNDTKVLILPSNYINSVSTTVSAHVATLQHTLHSCSGQFPSNLVRRDMQPLFGSASSKKKITFSPEPSHKVMYTTCALSLAYR